MMPGAPMASLVMLYLFIHRVAVKPSSSMSESRPALAVLQLKRHEERRLNTGHLWIYSNEVDTARTPLHAFEAGQAVRIESSTGRPLGTAYVNPHSLICARIVSRDSARVLDRALLVQRIRTALALRGRLYRAPYYRLIYGEADALPGLVVDRYGDVLVVQLTTAGMERLKDEVLAALDEVIGPAAVLLRNDSPIRQLEGLPSYVESFGPVPEYIELEEDGVRFQISVSKGQKTGWFFDQRDNRLRLDRYARGARVLDLFSYTGAWGIRAAMHGAREVLCVDSSQEALDRLQASTELNGLVNRATGRKGEAFDVLRSLRESGEQFDLIVLDPPAFIKRKKDSKAGQEAYLRLNQLAMEVLTSDGILVSASCSWHLEAAKLQQILLQAARHQARGLQILEYGRQSADHPVHPAIPESEYLKAFYCRVVKGRNVLC
jgi:23S rRNA (cytosine1962-C5)-methyltransferase